MASHTSIDLPVKPRVLIADDSRIVRATLIKHIEGMFDFREALDGEQAWETLLLDPSIRVVITDLTMPKLDGYGLLRRIRSSKITRIRDLPVVVVSGSDEREERDRARAAGANDLITKGIGTAQLLSRLDILAKLVGTQHEFERSLEALVQSNSPGKATPLPTVERLRAQGEEILARAIDTKRNFVLLNVRVGLKHVGLAGLATAPPDAVVDAIGQLLIRTIRDTDLVAKTGEAEFALATGNIHFDAARLFAQRICRAIAAAHLVNDARMSFVASCGFVSLNECENNPASSGFQALWDNACRRSLLGLTQGVTGVVGREEEAAFATSGSLGLVENSGEHVPTSGEPDLATLLQWVKEGRREEVLPHIGKLSAELQPLVDLLLKQEKA